MTTVISLAPPPHVFPLILVSLGKCSCSYNKLFPKLSLNCLSFNLNFPSVLESGPFGCLLSSDSPRHLHFLPLGPLFL